MEIDWVLGWLEALGTDGQIPPFCVELVLRDGRQLHLHSIIAFEKETRTILARIWDLRALDAKQIDGLKQRLNTILDRKDLADAHGVHPKLDWGSLHIHFEDVAYCVEWHDRLWPEDVRPKIGFTNLNT